MVTGPLLHARSCPILIWGGLRSRPTELSTVEGDEVRNAVAVEIADGKARRIGAAVVVQWGGEAKKRSSFEWLQHRDSSM